MTKVIEPIAVSIIVPVYKSAVTLPELHERLAAVAQNRNWHCEVIYVNDASPDHSLELLMKLPDVLSYRVLSLEPNQGQSVALLCGMHAATHPLLVTMDADLQDEPEQLPFLLDCMDQETDVVFATRSGSYESSPRMLTSFLFKSLVTLFSGGRIPRQAGLFLVIRKTCADRFTLYLPFRPYLIGLIARFGLRCRAVAVIRQKNSLGETSYTFRKRLRVARNFFRTRFGLLPPAAEASRQWWQEHVTASFPYHNSADSHIPPGK